MKRLIPAALLLTLAACGGGNPTPTNPTPTPTPTATTFALSGSVIDNKVNTNKVANASLSITDGSNAGRSTTADGAGAYRFTGLTPGTFTLSLTGAGYVSTTQSVTLGTADKTQNLFMDPVPLPLFTKSGTGNTVFDMPTSVSRIHITGRLVTGSSSNFIVKIGGSLTVNDLLGNFFGTLTSDGTYLTKGGVVEITNSSGVAWTFTEVR